MFTLKKLALSCLALATLLVGQSSVKAGLTVDIDLDTGLSGIAGKDGYFLLRDFGSLSGGALVSVEFSGAVAEIVATAYAGDLGILVEHEDHLGKYVFLASDLERNGSGTSFKTIYQVNLDNTFVDPNRATTNTAQVGVNATTGVVGAPGAVFDDWPNMDQEKTGNVASGAALTGYTDAISDPLLSDISKLRFYYFNGFMTASDSVMSWRGTLTITSSSNVVDSGGSSGAVPEPSSAALYAACICGVIAFRRRRR